MEPIDEPPDDKKFIYDLGVPKEKQEKVLGFLKRLYNKDVETYEHCKGVGELMGRCADLVEEDYSVKGYENPFDRDLCVTSGLVHDVGKLSISKGILDKTHSLRFNRAGNDGLQITAHVMHGLRELRAVLPSEAFFAYWHHLPYYPEKLFVLPENFSEEETREIYYGVRLLHIVDFYHAATTRKNNRNGNGGKALTPEEVKTKLIAQKGMEEKYILENLHFDNDTIRDIKMDEIIENRDLIERLYGGQVFGRIGQEVLRV